MSANVNTVRDISGNRPKSGKCHEKKKFKGKLFTANFMFGAMPVFIIRDRSFLHPVEF